MKRKMMIRFLFFGLFCAGVFSSVYADEGDSGTSKEQTEPTPFRVIIPTQAPASTSGVVVTERPTLIPTEQGPPQLSVREGYGDVNVRAEPDIESDIMGKIKYGEYYTITGRYYRWLSIRFEPATNHIAYVYDELVEIIGDEAEIPDLTVLPIADNPAARATETWEAILSIPGGEMTVTADALLIIGENAPAGAVGAEGTSEVLPASVLPTFTYPPNVIAQAPTNTPEMAIPPTKESINLELSVSGGIPPIYPIVVLAGLGILGFLLSFLLRR